ncbi:MAG: hypothetical protein QOJ00_2992 [Actinomycetota bacterium]|jgi:hypothetical protein
MGKASNAKKVNRAAATGGGRTAGKRTPVLWYASLFVVVVAGVLGVALSSKSISDKKAAADTTPPVANKDHWHAAYGFNLCGQWAAPLQDGPAGDTAGIHTHADGLVHTHPFLNSVAGQNATFGKLMKDTLTTVTATSVNLKRDGERFKNGDKCGKEKGVLTTRVFKNLADKTGTELKGNPSDWKIKNGALISISFNPKGFKVTQPPSAANLADPGDLGSTPSPSDATPTTAPSAPTTAASTGTTAAPPTTSAR